MTDLPDDELTHDVMLAEIQKMAKRSVTITINEHLDEDHTIEEAVDRMVATGLIDDDQAHEYIASGTIVQLTANGETEEETIDIIGPTLNDAIGNMYFYLKAEE